ncbi:MAG: response regulator, partial [Gammaproteobacteria bacterium]|nr:response regulator [Gammaproteobacteria bacterium]
MFPLQRILYVEDELSIQEVVKLALEAVGGFSVELCSSGTAAVEKAPIFSPDLILLDVMMPDMDGPSTLQALRGLSQTSMTPVIFITAKAQSAELAHYEELGAVGV